MKHLSVLAITASLALCTPLAASAATRSWTATGPNGGTWNRTVSGSCADRSCQYQRTTTRPNGRTATVDDSASCANGTCTRTWTRTGYNGRTESYNASATHAPWYRRW